MFIKMLCAGTRRAQPYSPSFDCSIIHDNDNDFIVYCSPEAKYIHAQTKATETQKSKMS